jgi:hypothetical protein
MELATPESQQFCKAASFTASQGDKAGVGMHVIIKHGSEYQIGRITEVLVPVNQRHATHVAISLLEFLPELHLQLRVLCIKYPMPEQKKVISPLVSFCWVMSDLCQCIEGSVRTLSVQLTSNTTVHRLTVILPLQYPRNKNACSHHGLRILSSTHAQMHMLSTRPRYTITNGSRPSSPQSSTTKYTHRWSWITCSACACCTGRSIKEGQGATKGD